jgi:2-polyprenyl-3-methyl-5-hydroxy-6-metoxy-1,4-benzoquinol methylase
MPKICTSMVDSDGTASDSFTDSNALWSPYEARGYWEERARRFAGQGEGLAAICSYGMPRFYNAYIQLTQWLALRPYLQVTVQDTVLDAGCGVGRWSLRMARSGARVTGVDLSWNMIQQARRRNQSRGFSERCRFLQADVAELSLGQRFSRILVVTVLQHILDDERCQQAIERLASHLTPTGRLVVLEAAPRQRLSRCDTAVFRARSEAQYVGWFAQAGLICVHVVGVDPMPLKSWYLPRHKQLPKALAVAVLAMVTALSLPVDLLAGRYWRGPSWHKVLVFHNQRCKVR